MVPDGEVIQAYKELDKVDIYLKAGDVIFFTWNGGASIGHTGIVTGCDGRYVYTVEGNTGGTNNWRTSRVTTKKWPISSGCIYGYFQM